MSEYSYFCHTADLVQMMPISSTGRPSVWHFQENGKDGEVPLSVNISTI